jgi:hypothetical protein
MQSLDFGRYALSICAAAAMFAGCGGSQPLIASPGSIPQRAGQPLPSAFAQLDANAVHSDRALGWLSMLGRKICST